MVFFPFPLCPALPLCLYPPLPSLPLSSLPLFSSHNLLSSVLPLSFFPITSLPLSSLPFSSVLPPFFLSPSSLFPLSSLPFSSVPLPPLRLPYPPIRPRYPPLPSPSGRPPRVWAAAGQVRWAGLRRGGDRRQAVWRIHLPPSPRLAPSRRPPFSRVMRRRKRGKEKIKEREEIASRGREDFGLCWCGFEVEG